MNVHAKLADAVGLFHLIWIVWIAVSMCCWLRCLRRGDDDSVWKPLYWLTIFVTWFGLMTFNGTCPLTWLENRLRAAADLPPRTAGFIPDLLKTGFGIDVSPAIVLGALTILTAVGVILIMVAPVRRPPAPHYYDPRPLPYEDDDL